MKHINLKLFGALLLVALAWTSPLLAVSASEQLRLADERYVDVLRDKKLRNDRENWLEVVASYEKARSKGPSAAAKADFKIGKVYEQLAGFSGREADSREAIQAYKRVAGDNPKNTLADDALWRAAQLHEDRLNEKKSAIKLYRQIIASYPEGDQVQAARKRLKAMDVPETEPKKIEKPKDKPNEDKTSALDAADRQYIELLKTPALRNDRSRWLKLIATYEGLATEYPAPAKFKIGKLYEQLGGFSGQQSDYRAAVKSYKQLADNHPKNSLADDSLLRLGRIQEFQLNEPEAARQSYQRIINNYSKGDMRSAARERLNALEKSRAATAPEIKKEAKPMAPALEIKPEIKKEIKPAIKLEPATRLETEIADIRAAASSLKPGQTGKVKSVRAWNNGEYVRVVIELDHTVPFRTFVLPPNQAAAKPYRLVLYLEKTTLTSAGRAPQENAGMIDKIRFSPQQGSKSRIVLDLKEEPSYNAFRLENPNRIVLDLRTPAQAARTPILKTAPLTTISEAPPTLATGTPAAKAITRPSTKSSKNGFGRVKSGLPSRMPSDVPSIARQLSLKVSRIVIDPGHGGKDPGAISNGLREKDVTLEIAERLAARLRKEGYEVFLTRDSDETVALEERTAYANRKKADLFISLHLNANRDTKARGIESYFLNLTTDETAIEVAARENSTSTRSLGELQGIINDLMLNSKINESSRFAGELHRGVLSSSRAVNYNGSDRGVRQAPFYVLLGAQMPSVLLELGFITNEKDASLLQQAGFQKTLVEGVWNGINAYINHTGYAFFGGSDS